LDLFDVFDVFGDSRLNLVLVDLASVATILGSAIAVSQLVSIANELRKRPKIDVSITPHVLQGWDGKQARLRLDVRSTNRGARTAHNLLWNYAFPAGCTLVDPGGVKVHHDESRLVVVRMQDHLHPEVTVAHTLDMVVGAPFAGESGELALEWTLNLQDEKPRRESLSVQLRG